MDCLVDFAPLVHWSTGPLFGLSALIVGYVVGRVRGALAMRDVALELKMCKVVMERKGWRYTVVPLRSTDMEEECNA